MEEQVIETMTIGNRVVGIKDLFCTNKEDIEKRIKLGRSR